MSELYPLRFTPIFRRYLWGGRRLETSLGKTLGPGHDYAESWEIVDHGEDQSIVVAGPLAGTALATLVAEQGDALFGRHATPPRFPLLWKFLDAQKDLSVQVHPNDEQAARLDPPDLGKTEAWVIVDVEPGSCLYAGLKSGVDRESLAAHLAAGTTDACLHRWEPKVGDCILIEAGTAHAIGAGLLVAEIQQSSDTTFRLFDWNRLGTDGKPRQLHLEEGLAVIDFERVDIGPQSPQPTERPHVERLVSCDKFVLDRWHLSAPAAGPGDDRCHILSVVEGALEVDGDPAGQPLRRGDTMLLPACCADAELRPLESTVLLDAYLP
ncbi:MAG: class I mannose-6-phosphate isomerase [Planctomycetota bacterium]|nr:MAG: class I mannose-6-phosphate isomerase [Planctomycetota bacterium]REK44515.1 MAG: class I mannose-6-phosphate isomerase [Planctomycetota bacterium]